MFPEKSFLRHTIEFRRMRALRAIPRPEFLINGSAYKRLRNSLARSSRIFHTDFHKCYDAVFAPHRSQCLRCCRCPRRRFGSACQLTQPQFTMTYENASAITGNLTSTNPFAAYILFFLFFMVGMVAVFMVSPHSLKVCVSLLLISLFSSVLSRPFAITPEIIAHICRPRAVARGVIH